MKTCKKKRNRKSRELKKGVGGENGDKMTELRRTVMTLKS